MEATDLDATQTASPAASGQTDGLPAPRRYFAVAVLLTTLVLVVLDSAIANIALPASASATVWVVSSYQLAVLVALLPCGAIGEKIGPRRVYLAGVALFTLASGACALSGTLTALILARFAQGLGGGAIMALAVMNLRFVVPGRMLGTVIGINAMTVGISLAAGPGIAGLILAVAPWHWLFAINIPLGILVLGAGGLLPRTGGVERRLDTSALIVNSLMFILFFFGADRVSQDPVSGSAMIAGALACFAVLLRIEHGSPAPLVPTDLFAEPAFRIAVTASICFFTTQMLSFIALTFYLQHDLAMSPTRAGLFMMPWPIAVAAMAPVAGRLSDRMKTAWLCAIGGTTLALGLAAIVLLPMDPTGATFLVCTTLSGLGFALFQTPNNRILLLSAPRERSGAAGAMQGTARLTGQTFGAIWMAILFRLISDGNAPVFALAVSAVFAILAAGVSLLRAGYEIVE